MKNLTLSLVLGLVITGCANSTDDARDGYGTSSGTNSARQASRSAKEQAGHNLSVDDVSEPQQWGAAENVTKLKHLYFSEQPDDAALAEAKANGVTTIIDLRFPAEREWDEKSAVEDQGLAYYNVPISKSSDTLDESSLALIESIIKSRGEEKVLLHCSTGNRAAAWLATHLVNDHQMPQEPAIAIAKKAGLTSDEVETRVRTFLDNQ